jgi:hypothetical protein
MNKTIPVADRDLRVIPDEENGGWYGLAGGDIVAISEDIATDLCWMESWSRNPSGKRKSFHWEFELRVDAVNTVFHELAHQYGGSDYHMWVYSVAWDLTNQWAVENKMPRLDPAPNAANAEDVRGMQIARWASARATGTSWRSTASTQWRYDQLKIGPKKP